MAGLQSLAGAPNSYAATTFPRIVWAHMVPHGMPDYVLPDNPYGTNRPLDLVAGDWRATPRASAGVNRALSAGVTGMQILQYEGVNRGSDFVVEWFDMADPTWGDSRANFVVAPCILATSKDGFVRMATEYAAVASGRPSAARVDDALVIYSYESKNLTATEWRAARQQLLVAGVKVFLVGELGINASQTGFTVPPATLDRFENCMDAYWLFDDSTSKIWAQLMPMLEQRGMKFFGGVMPGYNRETSASGGFVDPRGTKQFRQQWEQHLAANVPAVNVVTWNDAVEHSEIKANADWNITRNDINAFYSAKFRGVTLPKPTPQLYVTTPDFVVLGEPVLGEALVLNGSSSPVSVTVRLLDGANRQVGRTVKVSVPAGQAVDATTLATDLVTAMPIGRYLRTEALMRDAAGRIMQRVTSAPTVVYASTTGVSPDMRKHQYSIPASRMMPGSVTVSVVKRSDGTVASATAAVKGNTVKTRQLEVIQNTRPAGVSLDSESVALTPLGRRTILAGEVVTASSKGFYVARAVDDQERVAYSVPLFI